MEEARALLLEACHMCERLSRMQQLTDFCARRGPLSQWRHEVGDCRCAKRNATRSKASGGPLPSHSEAEQGAKTCRCKWKDLRAA